MIKDRNYAGSHDRGTAIFRLRTANDAISLLVSALSYQVTVQTANPQSCDYCGERYPSASAIAWASHNCKVLTAAQNILSECVQHLLRERAIAKIEIERCLTDKVALLRHAM